ncbi:PepSY domain-containing protein [Clostridium colicanis]|uniref:Peptidase propeptide and YPEB domain protein n=1 Tax=Clostridium colicanis DSM 13634 TaxID=1121305 RepID=A0A151AL08_9CLOT|nr:PepSY domain-containing protein [Clostridium colicanis]KYH28339.1 peptidase propeptide and YPEB domain protein [Clostridium colicanis DSM 13634]
MAFGIITGEVIELTSEAAIQIALQRVPGQVIKVELDYENGILVYEIDIRTSLGVYEVHVDAITGRILKVERDFD